MTYPAVIFWILFLKAIVSSQQTLLTLLFSSFAFGSLAVLPPEITGGSSFMPKTMFALLIVAKFLIPALFAWSPRVSELVRAQNLGFLLAFLVIGLVTTIFMPSLFAGSIDVIPLKYVRFAASEALQPSPANITQSIYLGISVAVTFATAFIARSPQFPQQLLSAVLIGGIVLLGTGIIDMLATAAGQADALEPFRNASYAMITNAEVAGVRRVVGLMTEASSYGSACVAFASLLIFLRNLYLAGPSRTLASLTAVSLMAMALLSTSSSAYVGLVIFGCANVINVGRRIADTSPTSHSGLVIEFSVAFLSIVVLLLTFLVQPEVFDPLLRIVDEIIFNKASSDSFFERSYWNAVCWNSFWSTYGLGVGLGGTRASNYFVAVISNTGFLGAFCFFVFLIQTFLRQSASKISNQIITGLKFSIIPSLGTAALGSATPDFEPWLGIIFGAIAGLSLQQTAPVKTQEYSHTPYAPKIHPHKLSG